jgi:quinol monooxygenase YgiN
MIKEGVKMNDNVFWLLEVSIKSGELDNFKALINEMVEGTQADEPNAMNFEFFISEDEKSCHIYERYSDSAAVMTHLGNFGGKFAERFMALVDPTRMVVYGNPSDEAKKALSGFGALFLTPIGGFTR